MALLVLVDGVPSTELKALTEKANGPLPVVTLTAVKHAAFASEETDCFLADVLIDGVMVGTVSNDGHGGGNNYWPFNVSDKLNAIAKQMPRIYPEFENDADLLVGELFDNWRIDKEMKRDLKKNIMFTKADGKVYQIKADAARMDAYLAQGEAVLKTRLTGAVKILNFLPHDEAFALFKVGTAPTPSPSS